MDKRIKKIKAKIAKEGLTRELHLELINLKREARGYEPYQPTSEKR